MARAQSSGKPRHIGHAIEGCLEENQTCKKILTSSFPWPSHIEMRNKHFPSLLDIMAMTGWKTKTTQLCFFFFNVIYNINCGPWYIVQWKEDNYWSHNPTWKGKTPTEIEDLTLDDGCSKVFTVRLTLGILKDRGRQIALFPQRKECKKL